IYLTAGYFIGGAWADRSPKHETLFMILSWAALAVGLIPLASRPILRLASNAFDELQLGALFGSFVVVMVLFVIPVTLIGMASPFAIRLAITDTQQVGKISGRIYAISTLGSFTGTFVPTLLLIPTIGTYRTFLVLASLLMLFAFIGLFISSGWRKLLRYVWMPLVIVALFIWGVPGTDKNTTGLVYETESSYNYIQVIEKDEFTMLRLNEGQGVHSIYKADQLFFNGPWEQVVAAPFFNSAPVAPDQITDIAIIGLAAGTTVRDAALVFPNAVIDGIEIDPKIVEVGRKYFDMNDPNLNVIILDGRWAIKNSTKKYDIISVDAYRPPYIPWHMTTQEFFLILKDHLKEDGVMVINIGRSTDDRRLIDSLYSTIHTVFPTLYVTDLSDSFNSILFATNTETNLQNFLDNYVILNEDPLTNQFILGVMATTYAGLQDTPNIGMVFTDDLAPIEGITNSLIMQFIFSGEVETLE
ncbi:MAG: spermine synthase, partial [Anaerolineae bacterium]|nr:spermine synthase [Anaerolineae bacterium]